MGDRLDFSEFIAGFLSEAEEHLTAAHANLLELDASLRNRQNNPKAVRELFRSLHTLKGLSAMVGVEPIVDIAHEMETLLRAADQAGGRVPEVAVDLLIRGVRAIEERVASLSRGETPAAAPRELLEVLGSLHIGDAATAPTGALSLEPDLLAKLSIAEQEQLLTGLTRGRRAVRVAFVPSPERSAQGMNITAIRHRVGQLGELVKVIPRALPDAGAGGKIAFVLLLLTEASDQDVADAAATSPTEIQNVTLLHSSAQLDQEPVAAAEVELHRRNFVRVDVGRLDDALERLAALVVSRARVQRAVVELQNGEGDVRDVARLLFEEGKELRDLRAAIMRARMVSVAELLERVPLIVRGLCKNSQKLARLTVDAGDTELDKSVTDRLFPVVVHLLRNVVDHAIELPEARVASGKSAEAHIGVVCRQLANGRVELVVFDDGRGIDRKRVASRAGVPVPATDAELLELISRPGLSTLDAATQTSGRGMGMEIVKRIAVDELGGELELNTTENVGSAFTLRIPVSITIVDAFSLRCGDESFVVPVNAVEDLAEIDPGAVVDAPGLQGTHRAGHARVFVHRGATMPLFSLSSLLGVQAPPAARPKAMIIRNRGKQFAFQVDQMLGQQEVVVRPVKDPLVDVDGISGSTDLGDGRPTLVLDLLGLMRRATLAGEMAAATGSSVT